jgi:hypothetical protein
VKIGWVLLFIVALIQTLSGAFQLFSDQEAIFRGDTGVSWSALSQTFPTVAIQHATANQAALVGATSIGLLSMAVIYFAFRQGQTWSWFAMWIMPLYLTPGTISLLKGDQPQFGYLGIGLIALAIVGLIISYRRFFTPKLTNN